MQAYTQIYADQQISSFAAVIWYFSSSTLALPYTKASRSANCHWNGAAKAFQLSISLVLNQILKQLLASADMLVQAPTTANTNTPIHLPLLKLYVCMAVSVDTQTGGTFYGWRNMQTNTEARTAVPQCTWPPGMSIHVTYANSSMICRQRCGQCTD